MTLNDLTRDRFMEFCGCLWDSIQPHRTATGMQITSGGANNGTMGFGVVVLVGPLDHQMGLPQNVARDITQKIYNETPHAQEIEDPNRNVDIDEKIERRLKAKNNPSPN